MLTSRGETSHVWGHLAQACATAALIKKLSVVSVVALPIASLPARAQQTRRPDPCPLVSAHGATIQGRITDSTTGAAIAHRGAVLIGFGCLTASDADGRFRFAPIRPGHYALLVGDLGYRHLDTIPVTATADSTVTLSIKLVPDTIEDAVARSPALRELARTLRHLVIAEEAYFADSVRYTRSVKALSGLSLPPDVNVTRLIATDNAWTATATHAHAPGWVCAIFIGEITPLPPARTEGIPTCRRAP